ncbi:MAG: NAD(+)/NADH kinase [Phycisphaerae bacterium]|jgi:NAD+ kinase
MTESKQKKIVVFRDPVKGEVRDVIADFLEFAKGKCEVVASCHIEQCNPEILDECDYAIVFGGDGSIISAARSLAESSVPVIGVNLGKLGFLAEFSADELKQHLEKILAGKTRIEKRMMLECAVFNDGGKKFRSQAVNEVYIMAGPPFRMIELSISVGSEPLAQSVGDGLIISTPTGSTAYNLSAGGPIISGKMEALVVTSICPHSLSFRPIVINADSKIEITPVSLNEGSAVLVDGQASCPLALGDTVRIERAKSSFQIVNNPMRNEWDTLADKLSWAQKPKYKGV